jgi:hypothetical protein
MSNQITALVERRVLGSATRKAVMGYFAVRASDDGSGIWTSKGNIAADTELSKRAVQTVIKDFISEGLVVLAGQKKHQNGFTYIYNINVKLVAELPNTRKINPDLTGAGDSPLPLQGVQVVHPTGAGGAPHGVQVVHPNSPRKIHEGSNAKQSLLFDDEKQPKPKRKRKVATEFPDDFRPSVRTIKMGEEMGFDEAAVLRIADHCADHHRAKGNKFVNHDAAFRNWLRNQEKFSKASDPAFGRRGTGKPTADDQADAIMAHRKHLRELQQADD